jgi:hypothetical protein
MENTSSQEKASKLNQSIMFFVLGSFLLALMIVVVLEMVAPTRKTDKSAAVSPEPTPANQDQTQTVNNELGRTTIERKGGEIVSIRLEALSEDQRQQLRGMLVFLEVSDLTANRACSLTLKFGGWSDRGEIHNCDGARIGALNADAIGYMREKISAALKN